MQMIWDGVMPDWPHKFAKDDKVYCLCMQKIYNWHTQFGKAALDAVEALWASDARYANPEANKDYVDEALSPGLLFMYSCVEPIDDLGTIRVHVFQGFLSPLILQMFASHLTALSPIENNEDLYVGFTAAPPFSALLLTVMAVEHALHLYRLGHKQGSSKKGDLSFSDTHWGTKTMHYVRSVRKVHSKRYDEIMAAVHPYCGGHHCITANHTCPTLGAEATEAYEDDHALIMVSSNIEPKEDSPLDGLVDEAWLPSTKMEAGLLYMYYSSNYTYEQPKYDLF
ncbi:hypothetical protein SCLCIDRAFT_18928 [Scleroderma citrinum Foug A]|uniref:Uncharacterized protein n=1 Tax=Scleroderma citrinum Foug A TaxID=1036808 RepID=A0A0C3A861_9AGAM|nr:hypothetical protein SCLCIDRAFT_18928 [Scleroderma citrinum Foug A]